MKFYNINQQQIIEADNISPDWINLDHPDPEELSTLKKDYHLNIDYVKRSLHKTETSHVQNLNSNLQDPLIVVQYPQLDTTKLPSPYQIDTYPLALILTNINGKPTLVTSSYNTSDAIESLIADSSNYKFRLDNVKDLALAILYEITQAYKRTIDRLNDDSLKMEANLSSATNNNVMYQIMSLIKSIDALSVAIKSNKPVIEKILDDKKYFNSANYDNLASLIRDEFEQSKENTDYLKSVLEDYSNLVSSIISNNSNTIMSVLTQLTVTLSVAGTIFSLCGVNYKLPLMNTSFGFYLLLFITMIISGIVVRYLHHKHIM